MTENNAKIKTEIHGGVLINSKHLNMLTKNQLKSFESLISLQIRKMVKKVRSDRHTGTVEILNNGEPVKAYLKVSKYSWLVNIFNTVRKFTLQRNSLTHEYWNLVRLRELGVPSITPIAAATRVNGFNCSSFILSESLGDTQKLEDYIPSEFDKPFSKEQKERKLVLINRLADITRIMHEGGVNHRDYYLCHIHILPKAEPWPDLYVIDLNRADRRNHVGLRWKVKDLAALNYSAQVDIFSKVDRLRFIKRYLECDKIGAAEKELIKKVLGKTGKIAKHALRSKEKDRHYMEANSNDKDINKSSKGTCS